MQVMTIGEMVEAFQKLRTQAAICHPEDPEGYFIRQMAVIMAVGDDGCRTSPEITANIQKALARNAKLM